MRPARLLLAIPLFLIFPTLLAAQTGPGCGPANVKFDVSTTKHLPAAPAVQPGKSLVYFLQDDLKYDWSPRPTTRFAIDGAWVGATHANSYFYIFIDPGEHHVCANWQSDTTGLAWIGRKRSTAAAGFTAEAGKIYYFRARDIARVDDNRIVSEPEVELAAVDPDEAQVLMNSFSFSSPHQKK